MNSKIDTEANLRMDHKGVTIWFTGLPSSGKTTIAESLAGLLKKTDTELNVLMVMLSGIISGKTLVFQKKTEMKISEEWHTWPRYLPGTAL